MRRPRRAPHSQDDWVMLSRGAFWLAFLAVSIPLGLLARSGVVGALSGLAAGIAAAWLLGRRTEGR
jgi:hypothetical protein